MLPFKNYPGGGREPLGRRGGTNCRHGYGLKLQRLSGLNSCVYCGVSLIDTYEHWLLMSVDHVVPTKAGTALGIPEEWTDDMNNIVLCCSGCNGLDNRFSLPDQVVPPATREEFYDLRDRIFTMRATRIAAKRDEERRFYATSPWNR